jgi:hypothetical protein
MTQINDSNPCEPSENPLPPACARRLINDQLAQITVINNNTKLVYKAYINAYFVTKYLLESSFYNTDERERRKGTGNQVDSKTGELEGTNTEGLYTQAVLERNVNDIASM